MSENYEAQVQAPLPPPPAPEVPPLAPEVPPPPPGMNVPDYNNDLRINIQPNTIMREEFKIYCEERQRSRNNTLTISQKRAVRLMWCFEGNKSSTEHL